MQPILFFKNLNYLYSECLTNYLDNFLLYLDYNGPNGPLINISDTIISL